MTRKPVYVRRYDVTTQSRSSKPPRAEVIETSDVLTIVVSSVDKNSERQRLVEHQCVHLSTA
jgi:hypothetical protein